MEDPQPPARAHVVAPHVTLRVARAGGHDPGDRIVPGVRGADDDDVAGDERRGLQSDVGGDRIDLLIVVPPQIDHAVASESGQRAAGLGVEGDHLVAGRDVHDPLVRAVGPVGQAAAGQPARRGVGARPFVEAEHPLQLAGRRVEREHGPPRAAGGVQHAVHHERRRLVVRLRAGAEIVGLEAPRHFQAVEVAGVDLIQRRVARAGEIRTVGRPVAGGGWLSVCRRRGQGQAGQQAADAGGRLPQRSLRHYQLGAAPQTPGGR